MNTQATRSRTALPFANAWLYEFDHARAWGDDESTAARFADGELAVQLTVIELMGF